MPHGDKDPEYWFDLAKSDEISEGLIARHGIEIPRIHDLDRLLRVAQKRGDIPVELIFDPVSLIQPYYADFRYPRGDRITVIDLAKIADAYIAVISTMDEQIKWRTP
jgi:HEPN domain-containing protein